MKNFRTYDLAVEFYRQAKTLVLPRHLRDQLLRAASSIALNLAEGRAKPTRPDQLRFFHFALGSLRECQAIFELERLEHTNCGNTLDQLGATLYKLIQKAK